MDETTTPATNPAATPPPVTTPPAAAAAAVPAAAQTAPAAAPAAATSEPAESAEMAKQLEDAKRYPALVLMSGMFKIVGTIFAIVWLIIAVVMLFTQEGLGDKIFYFFLALGFALLMLIIFYFLGEFITVIMDTERNTRLSLEELKKRAA